MDVYLNGQIVSSDQARVSHDDAGLQHGVGLFETMSAHHGRVFRLAAHVQRLAQSARELGMAREVDAVELRDAVVRAVGHNKVDRGRVRLTVTAGSVNLLRSEPEGDAALTVLVITTDPVEYDPAYFEHGITVQVGAALANPFDPAAGHKTLAYWTRLRLLRQAAAAGAGEAVVLNTMNYLAGGTVSNIFLVKDGKLLTPIARGEEIAGALPAPVLPGITRAAVIEAAQSKDVAVQKQMLAVEDMLDADEVFLTNSSWYVLPVTQVEKKPIGSAAVGPVTRMLRDAVVHLVERETRD